MKINLLCVKRLELKTKSIACENHNRAHLKMKPLTLRPSEHESNSAQMSLKGSETNALSFFFSRYKLDAAREAYSDDEMLCLARV